MKIINNGANGPRGTKRSGSANGPAAGGYKSKASGAKSSTADRVDVSSDAANLAEAIKETAALGRREPASEARLEEIKAAIEAGEYKIDPHELARYILDTDLGAAGGKR